MAGRDGTGPMGQGAMTGRGMGYCNTDAGFAGRGRFAGGGFGRGGRGFGQRGFAGGGFGQGGAFAMGRGAFVLEDDEKELLRNRIAMLEEELAEIKSFVADDAKDEE